MCEKLLLSVAESAAKLGCGRTYVYELISHKELRVVKLGRLTRVPASALNDFIERRLEDAAAALPGEAMNQIAHRWR